MRYEVFSHVTGSAVTQPYTRQESAHAMCREFNTPRWAGGEFGVRPVVDSDDRRENLRNLIQWHVDESLACEMGPTEIDRLVDDIERMLNR